MYNAKNTIVISLITIMIIGHLFLKLFDAEYIFRQGVQK